MWARAQQIAVLAEEIGFDAVVSIPKWRGFDVLGESEALTPPLPPPTKFVDESYLQQARVR